MLSSPGAKPAVHGGADGSGGGGGIDGGFAGHPISGPQPGHPAGLHACARRHACMPVRARTRPWSRGGRAYRRGRRGGRNRVLPATAEREARGPGQLGIFLSLSLGPSSSRSSSPCLARARVRACPLCLKALRLTLFSLSLLAFCRSLLTRPLRSSASWPRSRGSTGLCLSGSACELTTRSGTTPSVGTGEGPSSDCEFVLFVSSLIPAKDLG